MAEEQIAKPKIVHMAAKIAPDGRVSALCYPKPRAINLKRATWSHFARFVTCPRCKGGLKAFLREHKRAAPTEGT